MKNVKLAVEVLNHILDNPDLWDQRDWHCGTTHCFAGHVQIMGGRPERAETCPQDMIDLLQCSAEDARWLAYSLRTLLELHAYVKSYVEGTPYFDADGYDCYGFDRNGYDCAGYDYHGFDRHGHDRKGYDRLGFDRHGYNRLGFDRYGYDRCGYDWGKYNRLQNLPVPTNVE